MELDESIFLKPQYNQRQSAWMEHIPFAFFLAKMHKPKRFVELGTHYGNSYFAFCQAVKEYSIPCKAFAVDHWEGDTHAGFYTNEVYEYVEEINKNHFAEFSSLLKMTFDEAADHFNDGEIDLLHIDGEHSYESVKHDFETWLPKLNDRSIVLLHDTQVKSKGFGVWKFFEELEKQFLTLEFNHGSGLGVVCTGKNIDNKVLSFIKKNKNRVNIHQLFASLGEKVFLEYHVRHLEERVKALTPKIAQLFFSESDGIFSEKKSIIELVSKDRKKIRFKFDEPMKISRLRFDPLNDYTNVRLKTVRIFNKGIEIQPDINIRSNAFKKTGMEYFFTDTDSQIYLDFPARREMDVDEVIIELDYLGMGSEIIPQLTEKLKK